MKTFRKCKDEVIGGFNKNNRLVVEMFEVGHGYAKRYVVSLYLVIKGEAIERLHQKIHNVTKGINIISATMGGMGQDLLNMGKDM